MTLNKIQPFKLQTSLMDYHRNDTAKKCSKPYIHLTAIQKKKICQMAKLGTSIMVMETTTIIENNFPLTGEAIIVKARVYADRLGVKDFKGSYGWLSRYKERYNLHNTLRHCGSASTPAELSKMKVHVSVLNWHYIT